VSSARGDFAAQMGDQERDVHAAGEKAQVQVPVAAVVQGDAQLCEDAKKGGLSAPSGNATTQ